jgi:hypothetical protein
MSGAVKMTGWIVRFGQRHFRVWKVPGQIRFGFETGNRLGGRVWWFPKFKNVPSKNPPPIRDPA